MDNGQYKHPVSVLQVAVNDAVLPQENLSVPATRKFRDEPSTFRELFQAPSRCSDSSDRNVRILFGVASDELVKLAEVLERWSRPDYFSHSSLRLTTSA